MRIRKKINILLGKSLKESKMDEIISKKNKNKELTDREKYFYKLYRDTEFIDKDYMMLSLNVAVTKIKKILAYKKHIICNLEDRDGKLGYKILDISYDKNDAILKLDKNLTHKMTDKFLYNILFDNKKQKYSLEEHDEYFEEINVDK